MNNQEDRVPYLLWLEPPTAIVESTLGLETSCASSGRAIKSHEGR